MAQRVINLSYNKVSRGMNTPMRQNKADPKETRKRKADGIDEMNYSKEQREVGYSHDRPAGGEISRSATAAAAEARAEAAAEKKKEAKAKDERRREAEKKAAEEEIEAKKRAAAAASEALEKKTEIKSAYVREAARIAAVERAIVTIEKQCLLPENHTMSAASGPSCHIMEEKEVINATSDKHILKESSGGNISSGIISEREAMARAQRAREAARRAEEEKIEDMKKAAAAKGETLERTEAKKSNEVRELARAAAIQRVKAASQRSQNYNINAESPPSKNRIQKKETINATSEQYNLQKRNGENTSHSKLGVGEMDGNDKQGMLTSPPPSSFKTTVKEKDIVNVTNGKYTLSQDQGSRQKMRSVHEEDYHDKHNGARPKERNVEYSKPANSNQQNNSQQNHSTIEQSENSRYIPEKEIVSVTGNERNQSMESRSTRSEDGMNQYVERGNPPKMNDREMEESQQKYNQSFQNEHSPGDGRTISVPGSHQHQGKCNRRTQDYYAPPTQRNRDLEHTNQQQHSTYQHQSHHPYNKKQQSHYNSHVHHHHAQQQVHQRSPLHGSSSILVCGSCNEEYDFKERLPRNLYCGHSICTKCIERRTDPTFSVSCPHCPTKTWNKRKATQCPTNELLLKILSEAIKQNVMERTQEENTPHSFSGNDRRQSHTQHGRNGTAGSKFERVEHITPQRSPHGNKCIEMGVRPSHYCSVCMVWVCPRCAEAEHKTRKCSLIPLKEQLTKMKQNYELTGKRAHELLKKSLQSLENECDQENTLLLWMRAAFESIEKKQANMKKVLQEGRELMDTLSDAMKSVPNAQNLPEALTTFQIMEDVSGEAHQWPLDAGPSSVGANHEMTTCLRHLMKRTLQSLQVENGMPDMFASGKVPGGELFSKLRIEGGRFHLPALRRGPKPTNQESRALPLRCFKSCQDAASTLVFLDLSWRGKSHGRLYIRLTGDTLRGRQFLSLCIGEGGVSFRGTRFHRVWWKGLPGEHVWTGDYEKGDGSGGKTLLSSNSQVQVPAGREVPISVGLVAGRYEKENLSSIFRIYTREEKEVRDEGGFGQVEFGLDVVKEAVRLRDISDVMISDCGLVVEM